MDGSKKVELRKRPLVDDVSATAVGVGARPVHGLVACAAGPCGVPVAVTEAGLVADEDLAGDETVPLPAAGRRVDPLAGHRLNKLAQHTRDLTTGQQQWSGPLLDTSVLPGPEDAPRANARP